MLYSSVVSAVSIAIYAVLTPVAILYILRKFFASALPWIVLLVFFILRILGAAFTLAADTSPNTHLLTGSAICSAVGLGPLFIASTRLLTQCNGCTRTKTTSDQVHRALATFDLCTAVATVVAIVGGVQSFKPGDLHATAALKAGVCLYAAVYVCILGAALAVAMRADRCESINGFGGFRTVVAAMLLALTLLLVRVLYSLLAVFSASPRFSLFDGDQNVQLGMQTVEEWLVTLVYLCVGWAMKNATPQKVVEQNGYRAILRYVPFVHWFVR